MKLPRREFLHLAAGAAALPAASRTARAQTYPARPITMVVPYPPGGLTDVIGRILAEGMRTSLGQSVIIEAASVPAGSPARRPTDTLWWSAFGTRTSRTALPMRSSTTS